MKKIIINSKEELQEVEKIEKGEICLIETTSNNMAQLVSKVLVDCAKQDKVCAIFSMTVDKIKVSQYALCEFEGVDINKALNGQLTEQDWEKINHAKEVLNNSNTYIDDAKDLTLQDILTRCQKVEDLDVVLIDSVQNIKNYNQDTLESDLTTLAKALKVAVIAFN